MFTGHYQLGDLLPLQLWTRTNAGVPTEPDAAPCVHIYDEDGAVAYATTLPICDRQRITGYFYDTVNLDGRFTAQRYSVLYNYAISSTPLASQAEFVIEPGGDAAGSGIAAHYFKMHADDYILLQNDNGGLVKKKNPEIRNH